MVYGPRVLPSEHNAALYNCSMLPDLGVVEVLAATATTGVLTFLAGFEPAPAMAAAAASGALSAILAVAPCLARRLRHLASLGWVRSLRVGDTFVTTAGPEAVVSEDAAHVLLMYVDPLVGASRFIWFGRDAAGVAGLLTWLRLCPRLGRRTRRAELATALAGATCLQGLRFFEWGPLVQAVPPTTARVLVERLSWELERPVRTIQRAWRAWAARRVRRRKRAVSVIEDVVLEALYRPGSGWRFAEVLRLRWTPTGL